MKNIGAWDALVRIGTGALALTWANSGARNPKTWGLVATCGAVLLSEGITGFSPFYAATALTTVEDEVGSALFRVGPIVFRRDSRRSKTGCTLWGVTQEGHSPGNSSEPAKPNNRKDWPLGI